MKNLSKNLILTFVISWIILGLVCSLLSVMPHHFPELMWLLFVSYAVTNAAGGDPKQIWTYILSQIAGWLWAFVYYYGLVLAQNMGMSYTVSLAVVVFIVTMVMMILNAGPLANTPFVNGPELFCHMAAAFVFIGFAPDQWVSYIFPDGVIVGIMGVLMALYVPKICTLILSPKGKASSD